MHQSKSTPSKLLARHASAATSVTLAVLIGAAGASAAPLKKPRAPVLAATVAPAGSTVQLTGVAAGRLPRFVLSKGAVAVKGAPVLPATRKGKVVTLKLPLRVASGTYRVLACNGKACTAARTRLTVTPRLTHLLPPLATHSVLAGAPQSSTLTAATGGTVQADDAAGDHFALQIPAGALPQDTAVSIQPLHTLTGLPSGASALAGVRLEPGGLVLSTPAKLTVTLKKRKAAGQLVAGFAVPDSGRGLSLAPAHRIGSTYVQPVFGFSDHGLIGASAIRLDAIAAHAAASAEAQLFSQVAAVIAKGDLPEAGPVLESLANEYYDMVVRPLLEYAVDRSSASSAQAAVQAALAYVRAAQILGIEGFDGVGLDALGIGDELFKYLLQIQLHDAYSRCADQHDIAKGAARILGAQRQAELVSVHLDYLDDGVADCYRFSLDFDSDITETAGGRSSGSQEFHVASRVPITARAGAGLEFSGSAPLTYATATGTITYYNPNACPGMDQSSETSTYTVTGNTPGTLTLSAATLAPAAPTATDPGISVSIDPGQPTESYHQHDVSCSSNIGANGDFDAAFPAWQTTWGNVFHRDQATLTADGSANGPWTFAHFTPGSGAVIGTLAIDQTSPVLTDDLQSTAQYTEHGSITVTHTPLPTPPLPARPRIPAKRTGVRSVVQKSPVGSGS